VFGRASRTGSDNQRHPDDCELGKTNCAQQEKTAVQLTGEKHCKPFE
jgi:hypothetical protein